MTNNPRTPSPTPRPTTFEVGCSYPFRGNKNDPYPPAKNEVVQIEKNHMMVRLWFRDGSEALFQYDLQGRFYRAHMQSGMDLMLDDQ